MAEIGRRAGGGFAERCVEGDDLAAFGGVVEEGSFVNFDAEHFFQRHGLGAELDLVGKTVVAAAAFVFNRVGLRMKLHDISDAEHAESAGGDGQGASDPVTVFGTCGSVVHALVEVAAFEGEAVFLEDALDVDESALAGTKDDVLQAGQGEQVGFGGGRGLEI